MDLETLYNYVVELPRDADRFQEILLSFKEKLEFDHRLRKGKAVVENADIAKAVFFGDIHGDLDTLYEICKKVGLDDLLRNGWYAVFLGDYIDRGHKQIESLAFIAMLKISYQSRVITLRGNHEPYQDLIPYPHDYIEKLEAAFGRSRGEELYRLSREAFDLMPLALYIPGKLLAVHGGPPISRVKRFSSAEEILSIEGDREAVEDVLWSDPIENQYVDYAFSYRGAGKLWGPTISALTLEKLRIKLIIRGHEPVEGYSFSHRGMVLTIFTMKGYYGNSTASCLKLRLDRFDNIVEAVNEGIVSV